MKAIIFLHTFSQLLALCSAASKQCYYPDGSPSKSDFPCDPDAKQSPCCGGGFGTACLSNRLCQGSDGNIIRGSCSDKDWTSPQCANYCLGASTGGTDLISCSNVTNTDTSYCCDHSNGCCDSGAGRFNILPKQPQVWATWNRELSAYSVVGTVYTGAPTSTTATSTTAKSTKAVSTTSATTTTSDNLPTNSSPSQSIQSSELSTGAKVGIGVGVAIGATLIAAVAFLLWKLRHRNTYSRNIQGPMQELDGRTHTFAELDARGKLNQELRPPVELAS